MKVDYFIRRDFQTVSPYSGINTIKDQLVKQLALVVQENEVFYGVLTLNDIARNAKTIVIDSLTIKTMIHADDSIEDVLNTMNQTDAEVLPACNQGKILGLVFRKDLFSYIAEYNLELEKMIRKRTQELELAVAVKDMMFSSIAHDLKNVFHTVMGYSYLLNKDYDEYTELERRKLAIQIHQSTNYIFRLLQNLIEWSRLQTGRLKFSQIEIELKQIVDKALSVLTTLIEQKHIRLKHVYSPDFKVFADPLMIETVIRNLISNAIKFTPDYGRIEIDAKISENEVVISVADTGIGMSDEAIENLFRIGSNVKRRGTNNEDGSGLGLILCKEFVDKNNGTISASSSPGKGSTFIFTIPAKPQTEIQKTE